MADKDTRNTITSNETLFAVVEAIRSSGAIGLSELAAKLDVSKSTVHRHLHTLLEHGYVVNEDDLYRLSLKFLDMGVQVRRHLEIYRQMQDPVYSLANETEELISFVVEERGRGVFLYRIQAGQGFSSDAYVGKHSYLHHTSAGKVVLAHLPETRVVEIIDRHGLPAKTSETVTDRTSLFEELEEIREDDIAFSVDEHTVGLSSVGTPVIRHDEVIGGVSVAAPTHRLADDEYREQISEKMLKVVNEFELKITYS